MSKQDKPDPNAKMVVTVKTLQSVLDYLAVRPFAEVAALINALQGDIKPLVNAPVQDKDPSPPSPEAEKSPEEKAKDTKIKSAVK